MTVMLRVRTVIAGVPSGLPGLMTTYFLPGTVGGSTADATDCAARVRACLFALVGLFTTGNTLTVSPQCDAIEATTGALVGSFTGTTPAVVTGSGGVSWAPPALQILVRAKTGLVVNGRTLLGRTFLGPLDQNSVSGTGQPITGDLTAVATAFNAMVPTGATLSKPCVWHRPNPAGPGAAAVVTSYTTWDTFAILRSRRD